jgi:probable HAF family extracellular repeat protein
MRRLLWACAALCLLGLPPRASAGYLVTDLGNLGGGHAEASGINDAGQVVGWSYTAGFQHHAFLYSGGKMTDLGTPGGGSNRFSYSWASGINASGQVAGTYVADSGFNHAFLYSGGVMTDLGTLGGASSSAAAINNAGQVVGAADPVPLSRFLAPTHPFLYSGGKMTDLGTPPGILFAMATGINAAGQVVGSSDGGPPFVYSGGLLKAVTALGTNAGFAGINDAGQIAGSAGGHALLYSGGQMKDLGTLSEPYNFSSGASGINAAGQVVGVSFSRKDGSHAFLYSGGHMTDLNSLLPAGSGPTLYWATGINDKGQIVANGFNGHAYLLTPEGGGVAATPEPSALLLALGGAGLLGGAWRRRRATNSFPGEVLR